MWNNVPDEEKIKSDIKISDKNLTTEQIVNRIYRYLSK